LVISDCRRGVGVLVPIPMGERLVQATGTYGRTVPRKRLFGKIRIEACGDGQSFLERVEPLKGIQSGRKDKKPQLVPPKTTGEKSSSKSTPKLSEDTDPEPDPSGT